MGVLAVIALAGGCDSAKDMQIESLQQQVNELEKSNYGLQTRLAAAMSDADEARRWAAQLQQELANARQELASVETLPPGWQQEGGVAWTDIADDILFDSGKATLKAAGRTRIEQVAQQIQATFAGRDVWVVGHTDSDPIMKTRHLWQDNLDLSVNRAATVARELYKLGLDPKHIVAGGQGEFNPKSPNDTKANKAQNRRVQIMAIARHGEGSVSASPAAMGMPESEERLTPSESVPPEK
jgi:chemotaxis protein MotB